MQLDNVKTLRDAVNYGKQFLQDFGIENAQYDATELLLLVMGISRTQYLINSMDNIQRACCIYQQEENKIYAFYEGEQDNKSLTHYLLSKLPKFMIPEVMINVKSMPLTKNGKIDRKALMEEYNA